ncbi:MAG: response regulator [Lachnospiraceae bacterium]|nr:response regulator [Lachnospiraceae bacterium]
MLQKTLATNNIKELQTFIKEFKESDEYISARDRLLLITEPESDAFILKEKVADIRKELPDIKIAGITTTRTEDGAGRTKGLYSFLLFKDSKADIYHYNCMDIPPEDAGKRLKNELRFKENIAGILLFSAGVVLELDAFLANIGRNDVLIIGTEAGAGITTAAKTENKERPCIFGDYTDSYGITAIVLSGRKLKLSCDYDIGWKPIGMEMTVTRTDGNYSISEIDSAPATDVYKKYLGVEPDEYFVDNVKEFPLVITRGDRQIVRCPSGYDKKGKLYFTAQVHGGDKLHLSYANPRLMAQESGVYAKEMSKFSPEACFLIICKNRSSFLGELSYQDIDSFRAISPELSYVNGTAQVLQDRHGGGVMNSALIAIGIKEGEASDSGNENNITESIYISSTARKGAIPLNERMATFLDETTKELQKMAVAADAASSAKSAFLSSMSHEIRTPINAVLGMNEMILRENRDPQIQSYANDVKNAGMNLLGIINDILDFSKIEAGKMDIIPVDYELATLVRDLVNAIKNRADDKGLKLEIKVNPQIPYLLHGDEIRIKQVITNLLTNAVKYTEKGTVTFNVDYIKNGNDEITLKVSVKDTGMGIKEENIEKLFTAFERIEEERNRSIEGTGLGINITQRLLVMMGSGLKVDSVYGEGSNFYFDIKQKVVNWEEIGDVPGKMEDGLKEGALYKERFKAPGAKILVVDDTPLNLTVITNLLKETELTIDTAVSGMECIDKFQAKNYDVVLLDHRMPDMDGVETLQRLRGTLADKVKKTPVICLTANAVSGAREEYIQAGFTDYLTKPVMADDLEKMLIRYLPAKKVIKNTEYVPEITAEGEAANLPEWLLRTDTLNVDSGIKHCGTSDGYIEALQIFAASIEDKADEIEKFYNASDWGNYTIKVHALKSMARSVGADKLSKLAADMEEAGDNGNVGQIKKNTGALLKLYRGYLEALSPLSKSSSGDSKDEKALPEIAPEELSEAYSSILEMAMSYDYDSVLMVMDSLSEYRIPDAEQDKYRKLTEAVKKPDWNMIKEVLK